MKIKKGFKDIPKTRFCGFQDLNYKYGDEFNLGFYGEKKGGVTQMCLCFLGWFIRRRRLLRIGCGRCVS